MVYVECMISIININNGIQESTSEYQNYNTSQILIFDGYVKVREFLDIQTVISINTSLKCIGTRAISSR